MKNKTVYSPLLRYISNISYLIGISIVIPYVLKLSVPNRLLFVNLSGTKLIIAAIILVSIGFIGAYFRKGRISSTFATLGFLTIVPALISAYILIFGDSYILSLAAKYKVEGFVNFSLRSVPQVWILTASYLVLAIAWFWLWKRFKG